MSQNYTIYHNPRCSKSRQTLALIEEQGIAPEVVLYLDNPPSTAQIKAVLKKLGLSAREVMRNKEDIFKELGLTDESLSESALIQAMHDNPKLIERPIVVKGEKAVLGRPPENVTALF
ncbi:MAG: arsenate reductase (glutaredoxin) [Agarilytica sp.]